MAMAKHDRRQFLTTTAAAAGAAAFAVPAIAQAAPAPTTASAWAWWASAGAWVPHMAALAQLAESENVEIAAICDCDQSKLDAADKRYPDLAGMKLTTYTDSASCSTTSRSTP